MSLIRRHYVLRDNFPSLGAAGVAAQHFPAYHNPLRRTRITHDVVYASLLLRGRAEHHLGSSAFPERSGSLTIVAPGVEHEIVTPDGPVEVFNLYLDTELHALPPLGEELGGALHALLPFHPGLGHRLNRLATVRLEDPARTAGWLHAIVREQGAATAGAPAALRALLDLVLIDLARAAARSGGVRRAGAGDDPAMERVRRRIERDFADELRVGELARLAGCSPEHLARRFARYAGCPPNRYLRLRRIQEAMAGLRAGQGKILELALTCGFNDLTNFNRAFRAVTGTTPRDYRQRCLTGGAAGDPADGATSAPTRR